MKTSEYCPTTNQMVTMYFDAIRAGNDYIPGLMDRCSGSKGKFPNEHVCKNCPHIDEFKAKAK